MPTSVPELTSIAGFGNEGFASQVRIDVSVPAVDKAMQASADDVG